MRQDILKVTNGSRGTRRARTQKGSKKALQRDISAVPSRQSMSRGRLPEHQHPDYRIMPLRRMLGQNVGRPWDRVYSELREVINPESLRGHQLLQSLRWIVASDLELVDGRLVHSQRFGYRDRGEISTQFYIHPIHKLLCQNDKYRRHRRYKYKPNYIKIDDTHQYHYIDGIWYEITLGGYWQRFPSESRYDAAYGWIDSYKARDLYGSNSCCLRKRSLGKKEIRAITPEAIRLGIIKQESSLPNLVRKHG